MAEARDKLRVVVAASVPITGAGLAAVLQASPDMEVTLASVGLEQWPALLRSMEADVFVADVDEHETTDRRLFSLAARAAGATPVVLLVAAPSVAWLVQAVRAGVRGILLREISGEELTAAVRLCASGLMALSPEVVETMLGSSRLSADQEEDLAEPLTGREREVLAMLAEGRFNKEIAGRLHLSEHTVKFHVGSIMGKLGASSRTEAVIRGIRLGLIAL